MCKKCYDTWYAETHREQVNKNARDWAKRHPEKIKATGWKYRYGADALTIKARLRAQDGLCKICLKEKATHVDHDHKTGKLRGWLCSRCNQGLGLFKENRESLMRAVEYLDLFDSVP